MLYTCQCNSQFLIDCNPDTTVFWYAGQVYAVHGDTITRVAVTAFTGKPCPLCDGLVLPVIKQNGIRQGRWFVYPVSGRVYWCQAGWREYLRGEHEQILPATNQNRLPVPQTKGVVWFVWVDGIKRFLDEVPCQNCVPLPENIPELRQFPLLLSGFGVNTEQVYRDGVNYRVCYGRRFRIPELPVCFYRQTGVHENVWQFLADVGEKYAVTYDGIVDVKTRQLI